MFEAKTFEIPDLTGISKKNIEEHLKLYAGYVKFANYIQTQIGELSKPARTTDGVQSGGDSEKWAYELGELQRRFAFEFCGMRNHEYYFGALEGGAHPLPEKSALRAALEREWGSYEDFLARMKAIAMTRGVGWAMLYYDRFTDRLLTQWVDEQHIGQLTGLFPVLALDMWEHAYVYDHPTSEKKKYVEAFFENLNWKAIEKNFEEALG
jgi:Fe-Mn family superoxide dismutase